MVEIQREDSLYADENVVEVLAAYCRFNIYFICGTSGLKRPCQKKLMDLKSKDTETRRFPLECFSGLWMFLTDTNYLGSCHHC